MKAGATRMCEALIRVVDKANPGDPYKDCKLSKAGDIITVQDDGWSWGSEELQNPDWRIVKFTAVPLSQALAFLDPEADTDVAHPSRMLRRRKFGFDLTNTSLPAAFRTWLADATRAAPSRAIGLTGAQLLNYMKTRPPLVDPNVIG